jgi:microcystin-dependent protein
MLMAEPFVGEIRLFSFQIIPKGWLPCDGRLLPIQQYAAVYALLGNAYGGVANQTFGIPDLRGRAPLCAQPPNFAIGSSAGEEMHILASNEVPPHSHTFIATSNAAVVPNTAAGNTWAAGSQVYAPPLNTPMPQLSPSALAQAGASAGHSNLQPYLVCSFCIAVQGIFPPRP